MELIRVLLHIFCPWAFSIFKRGPWGLFIFSFHPDAGLFFAKFIIKLSLWLQGIFCSSRDVPEVTLAHIQFFEWDEKCQDYSKQIRHSHTLLQNALHTAAKYNFSMNKKKSKNLNEKSIFHNFSFFFVCWFFFLFFYNFFGIFSFSFFLSLFFFVQTY